MRKMRLWRVDETSVDIPAADHFDVDAGLTMPGWLPVKAVRLTVSKFGHDLTLSRVTNEKMVNVVTHSVGGRQCH
jgi:hypothetical protein